ncbi:transcription termination factor NusA [bacterium endosymbiont of Pedicinus badii]|uniref:transcription termination factor NusA n=1 Tax=bacterium endosymbiont of Pedicinus badii TaxID=1719126 RepID=UPI0009B9A7D9|nr:transcription termination factor NusA [bacterium endosymbiont of Pedicinus badii]OQM34191.1 transcription elongation factor NusA [bacterium endosymbiont of Pedicinus badii]
MNKEVLSVIESVSNEKSIDKEKIFEALEIALSVATRKKFNTESDIKVSIDRKSGSFITYKKLLVVDKVKSKNKEISIEEVKNQFLKKKIGEYVEKKIQSAKFDRIVTQIAKQVIVQKVREAERETIINKFKKYAGEIVAGIIKKITREYIYVELGNNAEALIGREDTIPKENFRIGDRIRGILYILKKENNSEQLFISRSKIEMLIELFRIEVPEIGEEIIEIKSAARDPGSRAKIAVKTNDKRIDPIGACIGMRGARVQAVSGELSGEKIDIVLWDSNPAQFVINAISPIEIHSIIIDEDRKTIDISVEENSLAQAIGKNGQNIKLTSQLVGWDISVMTIEGLKRKKYEEEKKISDKFVKYLNIEKNIAKILISSGFSSLEEIAYVPKEELFIIKNIEQKILQKIRESAKKTLYEWYIRKEKEKKANKKIFKNFSKIPEIKKEIIKQLIKKKIYNIEKLAEQSIDELVDIEGLSKRRAGDIIMEARNICWFNQSKISKKN